MRRFFRELFKFSLVQALVLGVALAVFFGAPNKHHYFASARDKQARLESLEGERLIIVGDSGGAYGIYSPILDEHFPDREPVNMALMAAVGLPTMLAEVRNELRPGDVVVLVLAYHHFDRYIPSWEFFNYTAYRPDMIFTKPMREWPEFGKIGFFFFQRATRALVRYFTIGPHQPKKPPLHYEGFNEYGDLVAHHNMEPLANLDFAMDDLSLSKDGHAKYTARMLNRFAADAEARGAQVFLLLPSVSESTWERNGEVLRRIEQFENNNLDFPILNQGEEVVYPDSDFFDTYYHLTGEAAKRRTEFLAERLKAYLDHAEKSAPAN
ncbi:MAG: hypothetical protein ACQKBV_13240 [Puniceicoccales bacterium]